MSQPILCASQFTPSESQKVDWSITDWFSVGQRVLLVSDMGLPNLRTPTIPLSSLYQDP